MIYTAYKELLVIISAFTTVCSTIIEDTRDCVCVSKHACVDNFVNITDVAVLDIRLERESRCENHFDVCCKYPLAETTPATTQKPVGCGYQTAFGYRITGDNGNAKFGEMPWTVVVLHKPDLYEGRNIYKCGGSLIHPQVVVTAAHCIADSKDGQWTIRAGKWNTRNQKEPLPHQDVIVKETYIHPQYSSKSLKNDIALLILSESVNLADNIQLICLPPVDLQLDHARCTASGWGKDAFKKGRHSSVLKTVQLPIVPRQHCLNALRNTRLGKFYHLHRSFICAGGEESKDTCKGDGGSPLVCLIPGYFDRYLQIGIVSWGIGCGENNTPGIYVNMALYRNWIDKLLELQNFDVTLYKYE